VFISRLDVMTVMLRCIHDDYYGYDFFLIYDKKEMKIYF
jgi:hypothetical protein